MELPQHYLPVRVCPHIEEYHQKAKFRLKMAEYGSHHNVHAVTDEEKGEVIFFPQKSQGHIDGIASSLPSLPLFDKPFGNPSTVRDHILGVQNYSDTLDNLTHFVSQVYSMRRWNNAQHTPQFRSVECCKEIVNKLLKGTRKKGDLSKRELLEELHRNWDCGLSSSLKLYSSIKEAHNDECLQGFNKNFCGGLLCHVEDPKKENNVIVHASGNDFSDLHMTCVSRDPDSGLLQPRPLASVSVGEPVSQICCSVTEEKVVVCARQKHQCTILQKDDVDSNLAVVAVSEFPEEHLSSVMFSPYIRRELLVSTEEGNVHLWDINTSSPKTLHTSAAAVNREWTCGYFAGHPRQIAVSSSNSVKIYDHRSNFQKENQLFVLSEDLVKPNERVMCSSFLGFPHHVVATDYGLFVMDQRFLTSPVLQWSHEFVSPPQYMQVFQPCQAGFTSVDKMIFVASQQPAEVMCFSLNTGSGQAATSPILPWQLSKIGQFANKHHVAKSSCDRTSLEGRLEASLAGLTVTCLDEVPVVYQVNSYGDVFYQQLRLQESHENESVSWSFPEPSASQKNSADQLAAQWLDSFNKSRDDESLHSFDVYQRNESVSIDVPDMNEIIRCSKAHLGRDMEGKMKAVPERSPGVRRCSPQPLINLSSLQTVSELPGHGSNTRLLLALKESEDITEVLAEREKHHTRLKKKMRAEAIRELRTSESRNIRKRIGDSMNKPNISSQLGVGDQDLGGDDCDFKEPLPLHNFEWSQEVTEALQSPVPSSPPRKKRRKHIKSVEFLEVSDGSD